MFAQRSVVCAVRRDSDCAVYDSFTEERTANKVDSVAVEMLSQRMQPENERIWRCNRWISPGIAFTLSAGPKLIAQHSPNNGRTTN